MIKNGNLGLLNELHNCKVVVLYYNIKN
jgi:hypothetical protein